MNRSGLDGDSVSEEFQEPELTPEQEDAAMAAGFAGARGDDVPEEVSSELDLPESGAAHAAPQVDAPAKTATAPSDIDRLRAELAAGMEGIQKNLRVVFGKVGAHEDLIRKVVAGQTAPAGAAGEAARRVGADSFKRLRESYPELAEQVAEGLEHVLAAQPRHGMDRDEFDARVNAKVNELVGPALARSQAQSQAQAKATIAQEVAAVRLEQAHPDWQDVTKSKGFEDFFKSKPPDYQRAAWHSNDPRMIGSLIAEYKTFARRYGNTAGRRNEASSSRQSRLAAAVVPAGTGAGTPTGISDDDALVYGFKSVRPGN
jgi:hypothetical protein